MLDLAVVDLDGLCVALEDHSYDRPWWIHRDSGEIRLHSQDDGDAEEFADAGWMVIDPIDSGEAYGDMADFIAGVADRRAADLLDRAIAGRGAFRRFKDTLFEFPQLRERWFVFHDARLRRRAVEWLTHAGLVSDAQAASFMEGHPDPPVEVASDALVDAVAADLRSLYGSRLERLLVFGSRARADADEDSDLDLLVVLDDVVSPWEELLRMDDVLWRHTQRSGVTVSALPVAAAEFDAPSTSALIRARAEAVPVG
jgi:predicted nucleotidyltransferase